MSWPRISPYRALPMVQPDERVFCKDCRLFERQKSGTQLCHASDHDSDPITGTGNPVNRNRDLRCKHHTPRSWWARNFG